jgi:hypothetical protein
VVDVHIPNEERPRPWSLGLVALVALSFGLWLAWCGMDDEEPAPIAIETAPRSAPRARPARRASRAAPARDAGTAAPRRAPQLTVVRGRLAYLRCDGVRREPGPFPCPRDEALEDAIWAVIDALPTCAAPPLTPGEADLRLTYTAEAPPELGWRDTFPSTVVRLDRDRTLACLRGPLAETRPRLRADRIIISFRFSME